MPKNYRTPKNDLINFVKWARLNNMIIYATPEFTRVHRLLGEPTAIKPTMYRALKRAKYLFEKEERMKNASSKK